MLFAEDDLSFEGVLPGHGQRVRLSPEMMQHERATLVQHMEAASAGQRQARDMGVSLPQAEREAVQSIPIGRMVEPEDIADLILFLVSEHAGAITGEVMAVGGGAGRGIFY